MPAGLLGHVPQDQAEDALWWHRHMVELRTGLPPDAPQGALPRPEYDPATRTLAEREAAKAAELSAETGRPVSAHTVRWRRRRHQVRGIVGMVDGRHAPRRPVHGRLRPEVVDELQQLMSQAADDSPRTVSYYFQRVSKVVKDKYGPEAVPKRSAFYRLFQRLERGRHTTGSARTRRSLANQPEGVFGQATVCRPGELMEIDSTPFDVLVRLDKGVVGRVEPTGLVDVATRSVTAAVLRPTTKSVDAALLLARSVTPAPMPPGRSEALRLERSVLPYHGFCLWMSGCGTRPRSRWSSRKRSWWTAARRACRGTSTWPATRSGPR
ncbi:hypothetical protein [Streptomyces odonnellii]|uniref:hypothetical protein n=1 Tax=Streptomyces odonnellii TaxID=1417980 RepID=UPI000AE9600A|nr:hypothetical protein [Streptomyces odonnellii]